MTPGSYRASDADRDQVAEVLHTAYAEGRITFEEHQERTDATLRAKTFDELTALTADLVPVQHHRVVEIRGTQLMGSLHLRVPRGVTVVDEVTHVMGETDIGDLGDPDPAMPTIVLKGTHIMSEIKVRGPKSPDKRSWWRRALR